MSGEHVAVPLDLADTRPPWWLIASTVALTLACLVMAVAETTLWTHFLIDRGEYLSLGGLGFILVAGVYLYTRRRLTGSLLLAVPWLVYPIVTQADQIIDNFTINQMRVLTQVILAILFATPIAVLVTAADRWLAPAAGTRPGRPRVWTVLVPGLRSIEAGNRRDGAALLAMTCLLVELWIAHAYLGTLMVVTLVGLGMAGLYYLSVRRDGEPADPGRARATERRALVALVVGVVVSLGLFVGYRNRPGAYQGSPHYYLDPSRPDSAYDLHLVPVGGTSLATPDATTSGLMAAVLADYGRVLEGLGGAYYVLDRNYNYAFHNALFLRNTPVLPGFRDTALADVATMRRLAEQADARQAAVQAALPAHDALLAFLDDVRGYVAFNLRRASMLEELSGEFERTHAGLQHATHLYEGEGKVLGELLMDLLAKHQLVVEHPDFGQIVGPFVDTGQAIYDAYSNRIVGF